MSTGAAFLLHPSVASVPLTDREAYLQAQGLTPQEMEAAMRRAVEQHGGPLTVSAAPATPSASASLPPHSTAGLPLQTQAPVAEPSSMLTNVLHWLVAGAVGAGLYRSFGSVIGEALSGPAPKPPALIEAEAAAATASAAVSDLQVSVKYV